MKINNKQIKKYSLLALLLAATCGARVFGALPFGTGMFMSFCIIGLNPLPFIPVYIGCTLLFAFGWSSAIGCVAVCSAFSVYYIIARKKQPPRFVGVLLAALSQLGFVLPSIGGSILSALLGVFFALAFCYVCVDFFRALLKTRLLKGLLDYQIIFGGIILTVFALGLFAADVYYFPLAAVFGALAILLGGYIYGVSGALAAGMCFGIGGAIFDYVAVWIAYFAVMSLIAACFLPAPRILSAFSLPIGYVAVTYFFGIESPHIYLWLIALTVGGVIYALLPSAGMKRLKNTLNPDFSPAAARYNINLMREKTRASLYRSGEVFEEMSRVMLSSGSKTEENCLFRIKNGVCDECKKRDECIVSDGDLEELISASITSGRASISTLPQNILDNCPRVAALISSAADAAESFHAKKLMADSENLAKKVVSEQLKGVGEVLKLMSESVSEPLKYDFEGEDKLKEEMTYRGIPCFDALLSPSSATLVVDGELYDKETVEAILKRVLRRCYKVVSVSDGATGLVVYAAERPVYDVVFSASGSAKGEVSGDTHSFIKIDERRFLTALCDGMGSGERAEKFSANTVSLIECFYKAGFDHGRVIRSVNRFLSLNSDEIFSAIDVAVIDLNTGVADIFKIGSPPCFVKSGETVDIIEGSSLPIGVLDEIKPSVRSVNLKDGDMLVLVSDGVSDCFEGDTLAASVSCANAVSPELAARQLVGQALTASGGKPRDDMTAVALRLISNV